VGSPPRWLSLRPVRALVGALAIIALATIGIATWRAVASYRDTVAEAHRSAARVARLAAETAGQALDRVDQTLRGMVDMLEAAGLPPGAEQRVVQIVRRRLIGSPEIRDLLVLDAAGRVLSLAGQAEPRHSDRDYFASHSGAGDQGLFVGTPIAGPGRDQLLLPLSRRFNAADGSFAGVVVAIVTPAVFRSLLSADVGQAGSLSVWNARGVLLARAPAIADTIGRSYAETPIGRVLAGQRFDQPITTTSQVDGIVRFVSWRAVPGQPFAIAAGLAQDEVLAPWRRETWISAGAVVVLLALATLAAILMAHALRRNATRIAALEASEARLRDLATAGADWTWEQDAALRFVSVSGADRDGIAGANLIGKTRRESAPLGVSEEQWTRHEALLAARLPFRDFRLQRVRADGRMRTLSVSGVPLFDSAGTFSGYRGIGRDITAEVELTSMLRAVIDAVPAMISAKDVEQRYVLMNSYQAKLFATTPEAAIGRSEAELLGTTQGTHGGALDRRVTETGEATGFYEERYAAPDGVVRDWLAAKLPLKGPDGQVRLVLTVAMEITAQKDAEKQLRHAHSEIIRAKEMAEQANRTKSEFLANVSHELRTPLNAIIGFSEMMSTRVFGPVGSERYEGYVNDIHHSALYLLDLIGDILDMAKIEAGKRELELEQIDMSVEIRETVRMFDQRVTQDGIVLETRVPDNLPPAVADRRAIRQILINLVGNAVKFTPRGRAVTISVQRASESLALIVKDEGVGIPADKIERLGTPFFQVNDYASRSKPGSGLGLAVTKALVELHGGRLTIESQLGFGTTVTATLPMSGGVAAATSAA
jgi:PAS domain S-box-containing protein